jgi:hypothetical protein
MTDEPVDSRFVTREYGDDRNANAMRIRSAAAPAAIQIVRDRFVPTGVAFLFMLDAAGLPMRRGSTIILPRSQRKHPSSFLRPKGAEQEVEQGVKL